MENELSFWLAMKPHAAMFPFTAIEGFKEKCLAASGKQAKQERSRRKSSAMQMNLPYIKTFIFRRATEKKVPLISCESVGASQKLSWPGLTWSFAIIDHDFFIFALEAIRLRPI